MAEAGLMPQRPWHSRQSDGEVMDGADDCDEQKGFFPEWTVFGSGGNVTDLTHFLARRFLLAHSRRMCVRHMSRVALLIAHLVTCSDF